MEHEIGGEQAPDVRSRWFEQVRIHPFAHQHRHHSSIPRDRSHHVPDHSSGCNQDQWHFDIACGRRNAWWRPHLATSDADPETDPSQHRHTQVSSQGCMTGNTSRISGMSRNQTAAIQRRNAENIRGFRHFKDFGHGNATPSNCLSIYMRMNPPLELAS